jgi:hypothetical protein
MKTGYQSGKFASQLGKTAYQWRKFAYQCRKTASQWKNSPYQCGNPASQWGLSTEHALQDIDNITGYIAYIRHEPSNAINLPLVVNCFQFVSLIY